MPSSPAAIGSSAELHRFEQLIKKGAEPLWCVECVVEWWIWLYHYRSNLSISITVRLLLLPLYGAAAFVLHACNTPIWTMAQGGGWTGGGKQPSPAEEEEEEFYKLRPANKTDYLCQSWQ